MSTMHESAPWLAGLFLTLGALAAGGATLFSDVKLDYGCLGDRRPPCDPKYSDSRSYQEVCQKLEITVPDNLGVKVVSARKDARLEQVALQLMAKGVPVFTAKLKPSGHSVGPQEGQLFVLDPKQAKELSKRLRPESNLRVLVASKDDEGGTLYLIKVPPGT